MDFIGLLGLLGLLGFQGYFSSSRVNRKVDDFKTNFNNKIDGNEKIISELQNELRTLNSKLNNFATVSDVDRNIRGLQQELSRRIPTESKLSEIDNALAMLTQTINNHGNGLNDIQRMVNAFNKTFDDRLNALEKSPRPQVSQPISNDVKILVDRITTLETELQTLLNTVSQMQAMLVRMQNDFNIQPNKFLEYERRINALEKTPTPTPPIVITPAQIESPLKISDFHIKKINTPLFSNNVKAAARSLEAVENLSAINSFLQTSNFDKKDNFIRLIKNYKQNLDKFVDKVRRGKFNEDAFSEEVTEAFFSTLSKYFLATLPVSIYRGSRDNPKFYADFLAKVNEYLAACHVYTELIEPNVLMKTADVDKMNIVKKDTDSRANDKRIDEVERLPYLIDYLSDEDSTEFYCYEGKMVVFKFNGGAK